jgi:Tfp pilus assembly protein PilF
MFKKNIGISGACAALAAISGWTLSAQAADFEQGCQFYTAKNYAQARACFEKAVKVFPENWLVHYYLANTYLLSGQSTKAIREYEACLKYKPNAATTKYCQDAILKLTGAAPAALDSSTSQDSTALGAPENPAIPDAKTNAKSGSKSDGKPDVKEAATQAIVAADHARAEEILKRAHDECKAIRAEAKEKIANGHNIGNKWYRRSDGTRYIDLTDDEKDAITKEAEDRCDAIMRTAESSAARLQH